VPTPFYLYCEDTSEILPDSNTASTSSFPNRTILNVRNGAYFSLLFHLPNQTDWQLLAEPQAATSSLYQKVASYTSMPESTFALLYQKSTIPNSAANIESHFQGARNPIEVIVQTGIQIQIQLPDKPPLEFFEPKSTTIADLYSKVTENFHGPFYLSSDNLTVYPFNSSTQIDSLLASESTVVSLQLIPASSMVLFEIINQLAMETASSTVPIYFCLAATSSMSQLYEQITAVFNLPKSAFALAASDATFLPKSPSPIHQLSQTDKCTTLYVIDTNHLLTVNVHHSSNTFTFLEHKSSTLHSMFPKITAQLSLHPDSFCIAQHLPQLIPSAEYALLLSHFVEADRKVDLHIIAIKSLMQVHATAKARSLLFGLQPDTTTFQMWQLLAKHFPDTVGFVQGSHWTKVVKYDDPELVTKIAKSGCVNIELLPADCTALVSLVAEETELLVYAHPDLVIRDMLEMLPLSAELRYKFVGPTGFELLNNDLELCVVEYAAQNNLYLYTLVFLQQNFMIK
jgi:hypothetical protein